MLPRGAPELVAGAGAPKIDGCGGGRSSPTRRGSFKARASAPSRYTGVRPLAQYSVFVRLGCVVSRPVRTGSPPPIGTNSIQPCQPLSGIGEPHARASYLVPSGAVARDENCSKVSPG